MKRRVFWLAGENSGDLHAAQVLKELNRRHPDWEHYGVGGYRMQLEGFRPLFPFKRFAVMGFIEVLEHIFFFLNVEKQIRKLLTEDTPDAVVLVDYPGLNLRVAKIAEAARIPVIYYICPQFWAWKHSRIYTIKENTHHVACILPFEEDLLNIHNVRNTYVGHPIAEEIDIQLSREAFAKLYRLDPTKKWISFFPGSRNMEVQRILPVYLDCIALLEQEGYQFLLSKSRTVSHAKFMEILEKKKLSNLFLVEENNYEMMQYAEFSAVKSGTTTLEAALIGNPFAIVYKTSATSYFLAKNWVKIKYIGLPNIIMDRAVVPELIQEEANAERLAATIKAYLGESEIAKRMRTDLQELHSLLGEKSASKEMANIVEQYVETR